MCSCCGTHILGEFGGRQDHVQHHQAAPERDHVQTHGTEIWRPRCVALKKGYKGYNDGLQPETLADGNWLVKQKDCNCHQPVNLIPQHQRKCLNALQILLLSCSFALHLLCSRGRGRSEQQASSRGRGNGGAIQAVGGGVSMMHFWRSFCLSSYRRSVLVRAFLIPNQFDMSRGGHFPSFMNAIHHKELKCSITVFLFLAPYLNKSWNYASSENRSPHKSRKRSHFGIGYRGSPPPQIEEKIKARREGGSVYKVYKQKSSVEKYDCSPVHNVQGVTRGLQGWPTARDSGWWQLAGETKSTSVKNWN